MVITEYNKKYENAVHLLGVSKKSVFRLFSLLNIIVLCSKVFLGVQVPEMGEGGGLSIKHFFSSKIPF